MKNTVIILLLLLTTGCTSTMYVAEATVKSNDKSCQIQTYWYQTENFFDTKTDEIITLRMGERRPITYKETAGGILYVGNIKTDKKVIGTGGYQGSDIECGKVEELSSLSNFAGEKLKVTMLCQAISSPLSIGAGYLPAKNSPYILIVRTEKEFNVFGGNPPAPPPPVCKDIK